MNVYNWLSIIVPTAALLFYFVKRWLQHHIEHSVKHHYERELETHKANLQRDYDIQIERLKAELAEKQFRFSHVFEKTADAIAAIYSRLLTVHKATNQFIDCNQEGDFQKYGNEFSEECNAFLAYHANNRLYVPKKTNELIDQVLGQILILLVTIDSDEVKKLNVELPKLLKQLEDDFQRILGFPAESTASEK